MPGYIHHIQMCVADLDATVSRMRGYGFQAVAHRQGGNREVVLQVGSIVFLVTQRCSPHREEDSGGGVYPELTCSCRSQQAHTIDSTFNVALEVSCVDSVFKQMARVGCGIFHFPTTLHTYQGDVEYAVVTSPCENVIHTLLNTSRYTGVFLPGFQPTKDDIPFSSSPLDTLISHIDHLTYVVREGESQAVLAWYGAACGMQRFLCTPTESLADGTVIADDVGLRLYAGEWLSEWLCREEGAVWSPPPSDHSNHTSPPTHLNFKLVLAEPLVGHANSHVNTFLQQHGGPGVQHVGLTTANIVSSVHLLAQRGVAFRRPPPTYYRFESKYAEIVAIGADPEQFATHGILIDKDIVENGDEDEEEEEQVQLQRNYYILQIFMRPLFHADTFFMELIQREGSKGFGAGNIRALAHSIIEFHKLQQQNGEVQGSEKDQETPRHEKQGDSVNQEPEGLKVAGRKCPRIRGPE